MSCALLAGILMIAAATVFADSSDVGNEYWVEATTADPRPMSLFCMPDGSGNEFAAAFVFGGARADATIELLLLDNPPPLGAPIGDFPGDDIVLVSSHGGLVACAPAGATPDGNTDASGRTRWALPLTAAPCVDPDRGDVLQIVVLGYVVGGSIGGFVPENLRMNSADLNQDGLVNLADAGMFANDLGGSYAYRSDFLWDGVVNISDAGLMASALGAACP